MIKYRNAALAVLLLACARLLYAAECTSELPQYAGYTVQQVRIVTPIDFVPAAVFGFDELKARLPLQPGRPFSPSRLSEGNSLVKEHLKSLGADLQEKVKFVVVVGRPSDCNDTARTLNVTYRVFTNIYRPALSHTFEGRTAEVQRPSATAAEGGAPARYLVRPLAGYDQTRHGYGGFDFSAKLPLAGIQALELHPSFSSNSLLADGQLAGAWRPARKALDNSELHMGFHYVDTPAGAAKTKEASFKVQFLAATRELANGSTLRYGASGEGGHQQTSAPQPLSAGVAANSGYGALKLFFGATGRTGPQAYAGSYGVQVGSTLNGAGVTFVKHVADLGYSIRFLRVPKDGDYPNPGGEVHRPLDVEVHASGGIILATGAVPGVERFFGGNQIRQFVTGESWSIPDGAYIRSIPQNRLGALSPSELGGTRFYAANLTLARVIWGRPLLPKELGQDPEFIPQLRGAIATAKGSLVDYYREHDPASAPAFDAAKEQLVQIKLSATQIKSQTEGLPAEIANDPAVASALRAIRSKVRLVGQIGDSITGGGSMTQFNPLVNVHLPKLETELSNLARLLKEKGLEQPSADITADRDSLEAAGNRIKTELGKVDNKAAQNRANQDFSAAENVLRAFLYQLNIYSVAPVAIFDVARVWPTGTGVRYAVGSGARLSLVNVNFTLAYAVNPVRSTGEGRGAIFLKLDFEDLFH